MYLKETIVYRSQKVSIELEIVVASFLAYSEHFNVNLT